MLIRLHIVFVLNYRSEMIYLVFALELSLSFFKKIYLFIFGCPGSRLLHMPPALLPPAAVYSGPSPAAARRPPAVKRRL